MWPTLKTFNLDHLLLFNKKILLFGNSLFCPNVIQMASMKNICAIITRIQVLSVVLFLSTASLSGQAAKEMKNIFAQAETYYLYEEYELANPLYLLLDDETNFNIKYKIGVCYLNISGEKANSIPYLEAAVKNAKYDANSAKFNEKSAPLDAYFFLAKAYMINNDLEKGLSTLQKFNELSRSNEVKGDMENIEFINQQIQACNTAIELKNNPIDLSRKM